MSAQLELPQAALDSVPATPADYRLTTPEYIKGLGWNPDEDVDLLLFRAEAHALRFSQCQFDLVMATYFKAVQRIARLLVGNVQTGPTIQ